MLRDIWIIFFRESAQRTRQSFWLVVGLVQPLLYMALYGPLVTKLIAVPGHGWSVFVPALLLQAALTQSMFVGIALLVEYRAGVLGRLFSTPVRHAAVLLGKLLSIAVVVAALSLMIIFLCHVFFRLPVPVIGVAMSLALNVAVAVAVAAFSYSLALMTKNEQSLNTTLSTLMLPLLLLSGAFLPITRENSPGWLYAASRCNPISYVLDASRACLRGDLGATAVYAGAGTAGGLVLAGVLAGLAVFRRDHP
ncbi:ABC transporter permease [Streptomyces sp. SL13]|uniref:Transport permease protein n=1 Tax=Streptantibioticus silvisoli TaxID=2705255 RepID=A0AA90H208_9ACTN|nr:ABC transporter permease [Streptantibioticus silvisoli]MDI5969394.1 ABC transporter permease [Streptantibioticus silvisoli]